MERIEAGISDEVHDRKLAHDLTLVRKTVIDRQVQLSQSETQIAQQDRSPGLSPSAVGWSQPHDMQKTQRETVAGRHDGVTPGGTGQETRPTLHAPFPRAAHPQHVHDPLSSSSTSGRFALEN